MVTRIGKLGFSGSFGNVLGGTMEEIGITLARTLAGFSVLLLMTRLLGKKQLGQLTYFTYITGIALGNIAGDMVVHRDITMTSGITGLVAWALLSIAMELIALKSSRARVLLDGEPSIVVKKGVIQDRVLARLRLNMDDLSMLLRNNQVFSVKEVEYAILEPNGQLSVLKKPEQETVTKSDLSLQPSKRKYVPTEMIVDGKIVRKNLQELQLSREWLEGELREAGIESVEDVFFAELQSDGSLYVTKRSGNGLH